MPSFAPVVAPGLAPVVSTDHGSTAARDARPPCAGQIVLPSSMPEPAAPMAMSPQAVAPLIRDVAPVKIPLGRARRRRKDQPSSRHPATVSAQAPSGGHRPRDSVELQIARLSQQAEEPVVATRP